MTKNTMTLYLAQMQWTEAMEPICVGANKRKAATAALNKLKALHGSGLVDRGSAMCSAKLTLDDIVLDKIELVP